MFFVVVILSLLYYSRILNKISDLKKKNYIFIILVELYASLSRFFFGYPDPDQRFLMRIRIRPNDTDPDPGNTVISLVM